MPRSATADGLVQLHVRRDRGSDQRDDEEQELLVGQQVRQQRVRDDLAPVGMAEHHRDRIGDEDERQHQEHALDVAVRAEHDDGPDGDGGEGNGDVTADTPNSSNAAPMPANSETTRPRLATIRAHDRERSDPQRELLADQRHETFARVGAESRAHLLDDDEGDAREHHHPQRPVAELRAGRRVRGDATGVVAGRRGDQPGTDDHEQTRQRDAHARARPRLGGDRRGRGRDGMDTSVRRDAASPAHGSAATSASTRSSARIRPSGRSSASTTTSDEPRSSTNRSTTSSRSDFGRDGDRPRLAAQVVHRAGSRRPPAARTD